MPTSWIAFAAGRSAGRIGRMATAGLAARTIAVASPAPMSPASSNVDRAESGVASGVLVDVVRDSAVATGDRSRRVVVGADTREVADPDPAARAQNAGDLGERGGLVGGEHDDAVGDDVVDGPVVEGDVVDRAVEALDVGGADPMALRRASSSISTVESSP
jgi:hypothetical protein